MPKSQTDTVDITTAIIPDEHHLLKYFKYAHLPKKLQATSKLFHDVAVQLAESPAADALQMTHALQKLLEAKDAAVRASLD